MLVSKLIEVLSALPGDAEVQVEVYGHRYGSERNRFTHGPLVVVDLTVVNEGVLIASDTSARLRDYYGERVVHVDQPERGPSCS